MKRKPLTVVKRVLAVAVLSWLTAATALAGKSPIVGYTSWNVAGTGGTTSVQYTFVGLSMTRPVLYQGGAESSGTNTLVDDDATWTDDQFNGANGAHYIEILDGDNAGATFDIADTEASSKTITLVQNLPAGPEVNAFSPVSFRIRKHWTIGSLFGSNNENGLQGGSSSSADQILVFNQTTQSYESYYYQTSGLGGVGWRKGGAPGVDASGTILYPKDGLLLARYQPSSVSIRLDGCVKTGQTSFSIVPDLSLVGNAYTSNMTLQSSGLYTGDSSTGMAGGTSTSADQIDIWNGTGYDLYYYQTSGLGGVGWRKGGAPAIDASGSAIPGSSSVFIRRQLSSGFNWRCPQHPAALESSPRDGTTPTTFTRGVSNHTLSWFGKQNVRYQLETSTDLLNWTNVGALLTGANANININDPVTSAPQKFYRLAGAVRGGFEDNALPRTDDGSSSYFVGEPGEYAGIRVDLGFSMNLFGETFTNTFVENNGMLAFDNAEFANPVPNPPDGALQALGKKVIAPFWSDVDTRPASTSVVTFGKGKVDGRNAFAATYANVGRYDQLDDLINSFQVVLIDRSDITSGDFDVEFNYDQIQWDASFASVSGVPARAGISNGVDRTVELAGAGTSSAYLDSNSTRLVDRSRLSSKPGRVVFQSRSGVIAGALTVSAGNDMSVPGGTPGSQLTGTASGSVNVTWSVQSAPNGGRVTFSSPNSLTTNAIFLDAAGDFVISLTATSVSDPTLSASDSIVVNVF